jgi:hypothetical protein
VLQKFLPAVFAIRRDQQLVATFGPPEHRALLPCLLASVDALVQAVDSYNENYSQVFERWRCGKKEELEKAADRRHANNHDLVRASILLFSDPFQTSSVNVVSSSSSSGCSSSMLLLSAASRTQR